VVTVLLITFFGLLILNFPIALVVLISAAAGIVFISHNSPLVLVLQLFNGLDNFVILAAPFFIMAGGVAAEGDTARRLVAVMNVLFGRLSGGLVIATIMACAFFAAISGSSLATVVAIGTIMIPSLEREGYPRPMAVGVCTSAGALGVMIPPSIPMVIMCVAMGTSVGKQFMAGFLPGIFIAICWSIYAYIVCLKNNYGTKSQLRFHEIVKVLKESVFALLFPVIVLGGIYGGIATPTEAAAISLIYVLIVEFAVYKKLKVRDLKKILAESAIISATLNTILGCAMVFSWYMTTQQVPAAVAAFITNVIHAKWIFLLAVVIFYAIAGCFMDLVSLTVILGPILIPSMQKFDIDLIHFGIIAVAMCELGFLTPPFGINLFVSMSLTKESLGYTARATLPYMIVMGGAILAITYIPEISLFLPNLFYR
jgi:C4-dicarboxylate transporter DctM subunit